MEQIDYSTKKTVEDKYFEIIEKLKGSNLYGVSFENMDDKFKMVAIYYLGYLDGDNNQTVNHSSIGYKG